MPATRYIVFLQVALLTASAAYLRSDFRSEIAGRTWSSKQPKHFGAADDEDERDIMWGLPNGEVKRFVLAEQVSAGAAVGSRGMGQAAKQGPARTPGDGADIIGNRKVPAAIPFEGRILQTEVGLSGVEEDNTIVFEPVPNGAGYSITADAASHFDMGTKTVVFTGNVALHNQAFTLSAARLVVHLESEGGQLEQMVANGNVVVTLTQGPLEERFKGWGEQAIFDPASSSILMSGWPRILGHGREHRAASASTKMTIFTNPAKLVTVGRAQTRILAGQDGLLPGLGSDGPEDRNASER